MPTLTAGRSTSSRTRSSRPNERRARAPPPGRAGRRDDGRRGRAGRGVLRGRGGRRGRPARGPRVHLGVASPRVCVIGLDGTPASYLRRRIADGFLPHLAELSRQGTLMSARAPLPPISSVSWASASTGVNPGRHGVFGFVERKPESWDLTFTNVFTIAEPQVWARAAEAGMRSVVVNIPGTYPAQPNGSGVLISGFVSP